MTPHETIVLRELHATRGSAPRPVMLTIKTIAALTGLSKDDTEQALQSLTDSGQTTMTVRSGVKRYATL